MEHNRGIISAFFNFPENKTNLRTEIVAGLTTFVTMAYIIIVNPMVLAGPETGTGLDYGAVLTATCLAAGASTLLMGLLANYPFALAPGMGLNALFTYYLCGVMGLTWQTALGVVFLSGCLALIVTLTKIKELIIKVIPPSLKAAITAGVGLFITFIGLTNGGIVTDDAATILGIGNLANPKVLLAVIGLVLSAVLVIRRVPGNLLIGIIFTTILGLFVQDSATGAPVTAFHAGAYGIFDKIPSLGPVAFQLDLMGAFRLSLLLPIFSLFFIDFFDTIGGFVGIASRAGMIDESGNLKNGSRALVVDSCGTIIGALLGTSNTTTYAESAAGVNAGGRTGMTAVVVALCFFIAPFFSPLFLSVPSAATAPALIIVGIMMCASLNEINWNDVSEAIPCILTIIMMPLSFSIASGMAFGFISYVLLAALTGRGKEVHWFLYVLSALFAVHFMLG
ncbi:NCS2 family permease [Anoxybacterium hadale]|uniref:NCS2 family permease n=1 Tax=Anoxybacterium hadale TaxID=3408580 RepID=A0ACD1ABB0_9FIRM|nr:NCS2 family permease [Clostridiales bacterium]